MIFNGERVRVQTLGQGRVELLLDNATSGVNQLDPKTINELRFALDRVRAEAGVRGVLVTSAKEGFMVGADLSEFRALFSLPPTALAAQLRGMNEALLALEDLDVPTVCVVNGYALGGGFEFTLASALRVYSSETRVALPEAALGLVPAFGGMVRLPRISDPVSALEWMLSGASVSADECLRVGVADAQADATGLRAAGLDMLENAIAGQIPWRATQERKRQPVAANAVSMCEGARERVSRGEFPGGNLVALRAVIDVLEQTQRLHREEALDAAADAFATLANTQASSALVQTFLNRRALRRRMRSMAADAPRLEPIGLAAHPRALALGLASDARGMRVYTIGAPEVTEEVVEAVAADLQIVPARIRSGLEELEDAHDGELGAIVELHASRDEVDLSAPNRGSLSSGGVLFSLAPLGPVTAHGASRLTSNCIGLNFFGPLAQTEVIELLPSPDAGRNAVAAAIRYTRMLGKTAILVTPGHASALTTLLAAYISAGCRAAARGLQPDAVDLALRQAGWTKTPFAYWRALQEDARSVLQLTEAGLVSPQRQPGTHDGSDDASTLRLCASRITLEFALHVCRLLDAGVATATELDVAALLCVGFPPDLGGPLQYLDWLGASKAIEQCARLGIEATTVPRLLRNSALEGQSLLTTT